MQKEFSFFKTIFLKYLRLTLHPSMFVSIAFDHRLSLRIRLIAENKHMLFELDDVHDHDYLNH